MAEKERSCQVKVLLFAGCRDKVGKEAIEVAVKLDGKTGRCTASHLKEQMVSQFPQLKEAVSTSLFAVNQDFAEESTEISEKDEVALIPPISGG
uniref:MOCS2A n=1 Tax=Chromera velia CCMP2878 TaxID=1169474 RepID=A0A0G4FA34_9ALVE|mmetsp:Transcript_52811/g.103258  ORF Transcript_52811/g.103258 Transcript_52811/m.103258 type:complete len:94 (-) Transcript_52811:92-373(-)|eukprot:Cvel_15839.t1-p1 / transcript=Cvel_15839.t1 / gene=Cvel_15839 / organism=Chromera_velia_CCMP2878 / gene_product=Molybdopterin synthase sulfur carrier subunit, putative / transcript_product=Molybdopterin synthase sulfur carrier subunit, putative / location=Cvel_scaffold1192:8221-9634(-) / protein_length=93 / sequence_SO=supercontig / SO=protein_coding / is_pseudo=false